MPWKECSSMSLREEFVSLALNPDAKMALLCRRFKISRKTGYKWLLRWKQESSAGLVDRSRRPHSSPRRVAGTIEQKVVQLRHQHRAWGGRKIRRRLMDLGEEAMCSESTVTSILRRHNLIEPQASRQHRSYTRFEHAEPNDLWQMDFKGHFAMSNGLRCHPLTVLDDHSRYSLVLKSCANEKTKTVQGHLTDAFLKYGLPRKILCDNGSPWGTAGQEHWTPLTLWLLRLGVGVMHGRPRHPQTQGKDERFHATLISEVLRWHSFENLAASQAVFDPWREIYNTQRPHEAIGMQVPAKRYAPSPRNYPKKLPELVYPKSDLVRKVSDNSGVNLNGKRYGIGKAFRGQTIALRSTSLDGIWDVYYCQHRVGRLNEKTGLPMTRAQTDPLEAFAHSGVKK
jgi:transposase InsO family protein